MQSYCAIYFFLLLAVPFVWTSQDDDRQEKLISTFQIVRFPNDACIGTNARNGTCYTSAECSDKGGSSSGSCADGFGVCCTFVITTCGESTAQNITYWTQPATIAEGSCGLTVCPVSDDVCQLRLDFTTFVITGPSTLTILQVRRKMGQVWGEVDDAYVFAGSNYATNCQLDHFTIQGASPSTTPPMVCGTLSTSHMYVEADMDRCNKLNFHFAGAEDAIAVTVRNTRGLATLATRVWDMTITQLECTHTALPPPGCTQYYFGQTTMYVLQTYNFFTAELTSVHLANQHQRICIRRERGMCIGCFSATALTDFNISGHIANAVHYSYVGGCCGYQTEAGGLWGADALIASAGNGAAGTTAFGFDCIIIPGAFGSTLTNAPATQTTLLIQQTIKATQVPVPWPPQICGGNGGIGIGAATLTTAGDFSDDDGDNTPRSICTRHTPFMLEFLSDDLEGQGGTAANTEFSLATGFGKGFDLKATQIACA
jgi:hypothetical protein